MNAIKNAVIEVYGLFVEDGSYAAAILVWLALVGLICPRLPGGAWKGALLFAGLAGILLVSVVRAARRGTR